VDLVQGLGGQGVGLDGDDQRNRYERHVGLNPLRPAVVVHEEVLLGEPVDVAAVGGDDRRRGDHQPHGSAEGRLLARWRRAMARPRQADANQDPPERHAFSSSQETPPAQREFRRYPHGGPPPADGRWGRCPEMGLGSNGDFQCWSVARWVRSCSGAAADSGDSRHTDARFMIRGGKRVVGGGEGECVGGAGEAGGGEA
jgi:hypothetical protein